MVADLFLFLHPYTCTNRFFVYDSVTRLFNCSTTGKPCSIVLAQVATFVRYLSVNDGYLFFRIIVILTIKIVYL
jgi:hypothetical protein